jgi:uncharacterized protein YycO
LARPIVRPQAPERHQRQSAGIEQEVLAAARTGDWLVTRGYHATDALVAHATGMPLSHAAVFNAETREVVEAEGEGVHRSPLAGFVDRAERVLVIRPRWRRDDNAAQAWSRAESLVGKGYDFLGIAGFNDPGRYYCSELAVAVYRPWHSERERFPPVIKPGELYLYGQVLYDSRDRTERVGD